MYTVSTSLSYTRYLIHVPLKHTVHQPLSECLPQAREATTLVHAVGSLTADGGYKSILGKSSSQTSSGARVSLDQINRDTALAVIDGTGTHRLYLFLSACLYMSDCFTHAPI